MTDLVAEKISLASLFDTGVKANLHLQSEHFTASDVRAILTWIEGTVEGINAQLQEDGLNLDASYESFYIVP